MLSDDIESLAEWVKLWVADDTLRNLMIGRLNALAADAHALERSIVPFHARPVVESDKVVDLSRRRVARPWPECR